MLKQHHKLLSTPLSTFFDRLLAGLHVTFLIGSSRHRHAPVTRPSPPCAASMRSVAAPVAASFSWLGSSKVTDKLFVWFCRWHGCVFWTRENTHQVFLVGLFEPQVSREWAHVTTTADSNPTCTPGTYIGQTNYRKTTPKEKGAERNNTKHIHQSLVSKVALLGCSSNFKFVDLLKLCTI